jgi:iron(III) transport system substrate-binding protein
VEAYDLGSAESVEKTVREQNAGIYNADVIFTGGAEMVFHLLKDGFIHNFVPDFLADHIPAEHKEPLIVQRLGGGVILYNTEKYPDGPPIDNIWDVTRPEWKGKVLMKNPMKSLSTFSDVANWVAHADELKAAYERKYGELVLSPGVPDAGYEFIYRLLRNDLVLMKSSGRVAKAVGKPGQDDPPIGLCRYSKIRYDWTKGTVLGVARIDPVLDVARRLMASTF